MATVTYKLDRNKELTDAQRDMIRNAKSGGYDPDCPPLTPERLKTMKIVRHRGRRVIEAKEEE